MGERELTLCGKLGNLLVTKLKAKLPLAARLLLFQASTIAWLPVETLSEIFSFSVCLCLERPWYCDMSNVHQLVAGPVCTFSVFLLRNLCCKKLAF